VTGGSSNFKPLRGSSAWRFGARAAVTVFSHEAVTDIVSVPAHRPIKPVYVRQFVALVDKVKESQA